MMGFKMNDWVGLITSLKFFFKDVQSPKYVYCLKYKRSSRGSCGSE